MNKVYLFVLILLSASFTGCIEDPSGLEVEETSVLEGENYSTLSRATEYDSLDDCTNGGVIIEYGIDENGNGTLEDTEVDGQHIVCHGRDGVNGENGEDGDDGEGGEDGADGAPGGFTSDSLLTRIDDPNLSLDCDLGGRVFSYGLDNGLGTGILANGLLEDDEIIASSIFCTRSTIGLVTDLTIGNASTEFEQHTNYQLGENIIYELNTFDIGNELWIFDINTGLLSPLKDINPGQNSSNPTVLLVVDDWLYFTADDGMHGNELWMTDGTEGGTMIVDDMTEGEGSTTVRHLTYFGDTFYFESSDNNFGTELFKWNLSTGKELVRDIFPGNNSYGIPMGSYPQSFAECDGILYFTARDSQIYSDSNYELWKTDGTEEGTVMVKDISDSQSYIGYKTCFGDRLYFRANDWVHGKELWKTDGTEEGTVMVKDINNGSYSSDPSSLIIMEDILYFQATNGTSGYELWKTDGTEGGTVMIKDINTDGSSYPQSFIIFREELYFIASDGTSGRELWKTNGTEEGTKMIKDIYPGENYSIDSNSFGNAVIINSPLGDFLYFSATDGVYGYEPWKSDGTAEGTVLVKDLIYGPGSSYPYHFVGLNEILVFIAEDDFYGTELHWNRVQETEIYYS